MLWILDLDGACLHIFARERHQHSLCHDIKKVCKSKGVVVGALKAELQNRQKLVVQVSCLHATTFSSLSAILGDNI